MYDKEHKRIVDIFTKADVSPAALSYKMLNESRYANESLIQYITNYIIQMADMHTVPMHLVDIQELCRNLKLSLTELGLTGDTRSVDRKDYLVV